MPNTGAFVAWDLITALFISTGWLPNEKPAALVSPMLACLLPLPVAYTADKNIAARYLNGSGSLLGRDLFLTQLRAILRVSVYGKLWVMFPMVGSLDDLRTAKDALSESMRMLDQRGILYDKAI